MFRMFSTKKSRRNSKRSQFSLRGRSLRYENMEGRLVLSASGFAGNECAPELNDTQLDSIVPDGSFSPQTPITFSFNAADVVADAGIGATATSDIRFILDPDVEANFRNNGATPVGASLTANDPGNNDQWDFSWTPTETQVGSFRLFIIATDDGGTGGESGTDPIVPLSDVYAFTFEIDGNPIVDLNGDGEGDNAGIDFGPVEYDEGADPVSIVDTDLTIPFASGDTVLSATITIDSPQAGDVETLGITPGTLTVDDSTPGQLVVTAAGGAVDKSVFEEALRTLTYQNTSDDPIATQTVSVVINDGNQDSAAATTTINIAASNDSPDLLQIEDIPGGTVGDPYEIVLNATDPENADELVFKIEFGPDDAVITPNAGQANAKNTTRVSRVGDGYESRVTFTPTQAQLDAGEVLLRISVTDSGGLADVEEYTIPILNRSPVAVADPETPPTAFDDDYAVDQNNADDIGNILANDTDADGDARVVNSVSTTDGGPAVADPTSFTTEAGALVTIDANGVVNYDPNGQFDSLAAAQTTTDMFWYTAGDGRGGVSDPVQVTITVFGRNDAPVALMDVDPNFSIPLFGPINENAGATELSTATILGAAFDPDQGDQLSIVDAPPNPADGTFVFTPATGGPGTEVLTFTPNDDPELNDGETKNVNVSVEVRDAAGEIASIPIRIVVAGVNGAPTANDDMGVTQVDTATTVNVVDNDSDDDGTIDAATVDLDTAAAGRQTTRTVAGEGEFSVDDAGVVTFTPESGFVGTSTIEYTVNDNSGDVSDAAEISVRVNAAPTAVADTAGTDRDSAAIFNIVDNDTDTDGTIDPTTIDLDPGSPGRQFIRGVTGVGSFSVNDAGVVTFLPEAGFSGDAMITYIVSDNDGTESNEAAITVTVNDPPEAVNDTSYTTEEQTPIVIDMREDGVLNNDTDDDGNAGLTVAEVNGETTDVGQEIAVTELGNENRTGTLQLNENGTFTFTPNDDFNSLAFEQDATVRFTYKATDGEAANDLSNEAFAEITVTGTNDAPTAGPVAVNATEDGAEVTESFAGNDVDEGDVLTYEITQDLALTGEGSVTNNGDGTFTYDPGDDFQDLAAGETRDVTFDYKAIDVALEESTDQTVTITVTGQNDGPAFDLAAIASSTEFDGLSATPSTDPDEIAITMVVGSADANELMIDLSEMVFTMDPDGDSISFSRAMGSFGGASFREENLPSLTPAGVLSWTPETADVDVSEYILRIVATDQPTNGTPLTSTFDIKIQVDMLAV